MARTKSTARKSTGGKAGHTCPLHAQFHSFPHLPLEIRIEIWNLSLQPRNVEIGYVAEMGFWSKNACPGALHACTDSRNAVIGSYPRCFETTWFPNRSIRFNFKLDTLYLSADLRIHIPYFVSTFGNEEFSKLRYLAIEMTGEDSEPGITSIWNPGFAYIASFSRMINQMISLREILEVYDVKMLANYRIWKRNRPLLYSPRIGAHRRMQFFDELPEAFREMELDVSRILPPVSEYFEREEGKEGFDHRVVFGARMEWQTPHWLIARFKGKAVAEDEEYVP